MALRWCPSRYPYIRKYLAFCILREVALFCVHARCSDPQYAAAYFSLQAVSIFLQYAVLSHLVGESRLGLWPVLIAMLATIAIPYAGSANSIVFVIASLQRALFTGRMLAWLMVWIKQNDLSRTSKEVMTGFGLMAGAELAIAWVQAHFGIFGNSSLNHLRTGSFLVMLCWWVVAFWRERYAE